ncbi:MAG: class B sortase [Oscillospiraceae bacterium]|nr:class B sortase [Oscillospiraceae bacterium]
MRRNIALVLVLVCVLLLLCGTACYLYFSRPASSLVLDTAEKVEKNLDLERNPVNFPALQKKNPDIYAWVYIPGTNVNFPLLQSSTEDTDYYLSHSVDGEEDSLGCLITQSKYNSNDFSDPVTVIYGRKSAARLGQLEKYFLSSDSLLKFDVVLVYNKNGVLRYQVIGATEYENPHILNQYRCFEDVSQIPVFWDRLHSYRTLLHQFDESVSVTEDDRLLVFSTGLSSNSDHRFLVVAKLVR